MPGYFRDTNCHVWEISCGQDPFLASVGSFDGQFAEGAPDMISL